MQLKTVVKVGTVVSVLLFCLAVGFYAFMRLDMADRYRKVSLFSLVPSNSMGVLECDHIQGFLDECSVLNYSDELGQMQFPGVFGFLLSELELHAAEHEHGSGSVMGHLMVSFHQPLTAHDMVLYFQMEHADEQVLSDIFRDYAEGNFLPKEEMYRGKIIQVYPLSHEEFVAVYAEEGFFVMSYQKRLIEEVIDARLDGKSLGGDELFAKVVEKKKTPDYLTLYTQSPVMPFLKTRQACWTEYDFHLNSDVAYLTGETFASDDLQEAFMESVRKVTFRNEPDFLLSADKDSTAHSMNLADEANECGNRTLFNECVVNLFNEASFTLVVDMERVAEQPGRFCDYLPPFMLDNASLFRPFILSAQLTLNGKRPSHIWVFTYKH